MPTEVTSTREMSHQSCCNLKLKTQFRFFKDSPSSTSPIMLSNPSDFQFLFDCILDMKMYSWKSYWRKFWQFYEFLKFQMISSTFFDWLSSSFSQSSINKATIIRNPTFFLILTQHLPTLTVTKTNQFLEIHTKKGKKTQVVVTIA